MNANTIIDAEMSLDAKLEAIDKIMAEATVKENKEYGVQSDPADLTMCLGCQ